MNESTLILEPVAPNLGVALQAGRHLDSLAGKVVGFIDNAKPNFDRLVDELAELLVSKYGVARVVKHRKRSAAIPAPEEIMQDIVAQCDAVITGSGD